MPSASCCFFHVFYIAGNQYQMKSKCNETPQRIFMDQKERNGPWLRLGVPQGGHNPPGRAWASRRALVGCAPLGAAPGYFFGPLDVFWSKKSTKSFAVFGLRLILISCDVKNMQKIATGTWHYVNRLVPKNDIK